MVSFKRPFLEREKKVTFLHLGFLVLADGQGRVRNLFWFCLISPGRGGAGSCTRGTPEPCPPPHYVARGARPPDRFQDSATAETRCDLVACTVFPGPLPPLSLLDLPPPVLSPHPSLPSENPASWAVAWAERSGGGRPRQDGYDLGHGNCDPCVLVLWPWLASSSSCVWAPWGWSLGFLLFFGFFSLDSCFFFKDGKLTRIALYTLGTGWKDFGIAVGGGGHQSNRRAGSVLFLFSKTDKCDSGACPLPGGVTHGLPHLTAPIETSVSCPEDT